MGDDGRGDGALERAARLSRAEAELFLSEVLGMDLAQARDELANDRVGFLDRLVHTYRRTVPFQSISILATGELPSMAEVKARSWTKKGGLCFPVNIFMKHLLEALGYDVTLTMSLIHDWARHPTTLVRNLARPGDLFNVDVGCGYVIPEAVEIPMAVGACSRIYEHAYLRLRMVREQTPKGERVVRYHSHSATHKTPVGGVVDESNEPVHPFWVMDLVPCSLAEVVAACGPIYSTYNKLRVVLARGEDLRVTAFKNDLMLSGVPGSREIEIYRFVNPEERFEALVEALPQFDPKQIRTAVARAK